MFIRYQKFQKGKKSVGSPRDAPTPKYVILEEIEEEEESLTSPNVRFTKWIYD